MRLREVRKPLSNRCGRKRQSDETCIYDTRPFSRVGATSQAGPGLKPGFITDAQLPASKYAPAAAQTYVGEGGVGEEREAFEQVLVVIVLDHRRSVGLQQKLGGFTKPNGHRHTYTCFTSKQRKDGELKKPKTTVLFNNSLRINTCAAMMLWKGLNC